MSAWLVLGVFNFRLPFQKKSDAEFSEITVEECQDISFQKLITARDSNGRFFHRQDRSCTDRRFY